MRVPEPSPAIAPEGLAQPLTPMWCELCHGPASENDWSMTAQMVVCPQCIEETLNGNVV